MRTLLLAIALTLVACSGARPPAAAPAPAAVQRVDGATARRLVEQGARLLDVRTREEYDAGHVPGALLIPYDQLEARAGEVGPPGEPVVVYCRSGRRSAIAAETLRRLGFVRVHDLGPMDAWGAQASAR